MTAGFEVRQLSGQDERRGFDCDVTQLTSYFREQVGQDVRRRFSNCFVAAENASGAIAGYYTLASGSVGLEQLPHDTARRLPRYPEAPVTLLGRLAVDTRFKGKGLGQALLFDALRRTLEAAPASFAMVVDAKDEEAAAFYRKHRFVPLQERSLRLFLPMSIALPLLD
ncbi:MAG: GNAT family N-acetyltransferase [Rhizobiaceae bacterium]|nr:GNAT family N-acetyltransferase [Rhizobiaceae bacterium]